MKTDYQKKTQKEPELKHRGIKILFHSRCHISENQHNVKQQQQQEFGVHNRKTSKKQLHDTLCNQLPLPLETSSC